jgi:hypothetical protein
MRAWKAMAATGVAAVLALCGGARASAALDPAYLDRLLAPVALYPDQLLAQILLCSENSSKVTELGAWLKQNAKLKGSELQQAASQAGFEPSFVALAPFPQVVELMAGNLQWTSQIGGAFAVDRSAVFDSVQRLRKQSQAAGNLKSTPQQTVESRTTQGGEQVIVIEPANPQVVYVPRYDPQVVYTQAAPTTTTVVVHEEHHDDDAAVAGALIGFTAGVVIGAAINDNHYYGPYGAYGYRGGAYMYNDAWDDWYDDREDAREDFYDNREDAREDWQDHREDMAGERSDRAQNAQEQRTQRQEPRSSSEASAQRQQQRTDRQETRGTPEAQAQRDERRTDAQQARSSGRTGEAQATSTATQSRAGSGERSRASAERSGTRSDAFSDYSSGRSTREASSRGERSRSRSTSGGGRSRRR